MSLKYSMIEIFTQEEARYRHRPVYEAIVEQVRGLKTAARCIVIKGMEGCYENGDIATRNILELSYNMPVKIEILLPAAERDRLLSTVQEMVGEGIVAVREVEICSYKTHKSLIPKQIKVKDVMTPSPVSVTTATSVKEIIKLLLSSIFNGVPVIDADRRPIGIITQGDLIQRAKMPLRLGLLAELDWEHVGPALETLAHQQAGEIMTRPVISIGADEPLTKAVDLMLQRKLKRLPVVDESGRLVGMLARLDVFHTITQESPDWQVIGKYNVVVGNVRLVADIMHRDIHAVLPDTPIEEIIPIIDSNDIQRIAVTDAEGRFLGMISDQDLLAAFSEHHPGIWERFASNLLFAKKEQRHELLGKELQEKTAADVMKTELITVQEETSIDEAIRLMADKGIKRLPVVAADGKFRGIVSRDSLLRAGFASSDPSPASAPAVAD